MTLFAISICGS